MAGVVAHFRRDWDELRRGKPGHRFQDRYDASSRERAQGNWIKRGVKIVGGIVAIVIGLAEMVFPGPATVFIALGGALLATQFRFVAVAMDGLEVELRRLLRFGRARWRRASAAARVAAVSGVALVGVLGSYAMYQVVWD